MRKCKDVAPKTCGKKPVLALTSLMSRRKLGWRFGETESDFGIDMTLRSVVIRDGRRRDIGPHIDLQLKSTTRINLSDTHLNYDLPVVNYEDLREAHPPTPLCSCVLVLPDDEARWLSQSPEELTLRHCA